MTIVVKEFGQQTLLVNYHYSYIFRIFLLNHYEANIKIIKNI